jgi:WD40 repeat protein
LLASGGEDGLVKVWDLHTGQEQGTLIGHMTPVFALAFSHDGDTLLSAGGSLGLFLGDIRRPGEIKVWGRECWESVASFPGSHPAALSPDGKILARVRTGPPRARATPGQAATIELWDTATARSRGRLVSRTPGADFRAIVFSPSSKQIATVDSTPAVCLWDVEDGQLLHVLHPEGHAVLAAAFAPDGRILATWDRVRGLPVFGKEKPPDPLIELWDVNTGRQCASMAGWGQLDFTPDSRWLVADGKDSALHLYDPNNGAERAALALGGDTVDQIKVSPDGQLLAASLNHGTGPNLRSQITVWDLTTARELVSYREPAWDVQCLAFSPDSKVLASGHGNAFVEGGRIKLRDSRTLQTHALLLGHQYAVKELAFAPDGKTLASAVDVIKLWDPVTGQELASLLRGWPIQFSPDGRFLLASSSLDQQGIRLLWAATQAEVRARAEADNRARRIELEGEPAVQ